MESKITSSFIPKKPVVEVSNPASVRYRSSGVDFLLLISIVALVVAGVLSAGVFLYHNLTVTDAASQKDQLEKAREAFDTRLLDELTTTSDRIKVADGILAEHTAPSLFLESLERDTLTGVQFLEMKYEQKTPSTASIALKGKSANMNTVALQSARFGESSLLKNPIFAGVDLVPDGVTFDVTGEVDLNAIRYSSVAKSLNFVPQGSANSANVMEAIEGLGGSFGTPNAGAPGNNTQPQ